MRSIKDILGKRAPEYLPTLTARAIFEFPVFFNEILGFNDPCKLSEFQTTSMKIVVDERYVSLLWSRGHLKTTIWSVAYTCWRLWRENNIKICIVSSSLDQSMGMISLIQKAIEENDMLKKLSPTDRGDTWNKSQLNTSNGNSCFIKPFSDSARGVHVDYLIMDDILRATDISQDEIKNRFWGIFFPMVQTTRGQILLVGTPMHANDLLMTLYKNDQWFGLKQPAVFTDSEGNWLKPSWDNRFTLKELEGVKSNMGSLQWQREYMCNPMASGSSIFKRINIGTHVELAEPRENCVYYMGIDIAMSEAKAADFTVFSIIEKDENGMMLQIKQERYHGYDESQIIERLNQLYQTFHLRKIYIEEKGLSKGIVKTVTTPSLNPTSFPVIEGYRTARSGNHSKEALISRLDVAFLSNELHILDNQILIDELNAFKIKENTRTGSSTYEGVGEHDDTVIALALAVMAATDRAGQASIMVL